MTSALIVWGGWEGHEPEACATLFADILRQQDVEVTVSASLESYTDKALMDSVQLVIPMWTMGEISKEQSAGLRAAVLRGVGLAGWHGGMCDAFRNDVNYQFMTGGQWVQHPGGIIDYSVQIINNDHPLTQGIAEFSMHSEQYYMHCDPGNTVLATTTFAGDQEGMDWIAGTVMPVAWTRTYGKGRVFYSSLGHIRSDFEVPEAREIMRRGLLWAACREDLS